MLTHISAPIASLTAHALMQLVLTLNIQSWADEIFVEHQLKNNKIADIFFRWNDEEYIVEVKSEYKQSLIEDALSKYWSQCDYLLYAAPRRKIPKDTDSNIYSWDCPRVEKVGLIAIEDFGMNLIRPPELLKRKPGLRS